MDDGICLADIGEELVAEAFASAGTCDETSNVDESDGCRDDFLGVVHFLQIAQACVGDGDDAGIWLNCRKRIISR